MEISFADLKKGRSSSSSTKLQARLNALTDNVNGSGLTTINSNGGLERISSNLNSALNQNNSTSNISKTIHKYSASIIKEVDEKLKKSSTDIIFIIDASYTCYPYVEATQRGIIDFLHKQGSIESNTHATMVIFSSRDNIQTLFERKLASDVKADDVKYTANGNTCLYDAFGSTVETTKALHDRLGSDKPTHTMVVVMTDGINNDSYMYGSKECQKLVRDRKTKDGWEFLYFGALNNKTEVQNQASLLGITEPNLAQLYLPKYTEVNFVALSEAVSNIREGGDISPDWAAAVQQTLDMEQQANNMIGQQSNIGIEQHSNPYTKRR